MGRYTGKEGHHVVPVKEAGLAGLEFNLKHLWNPVGIIVDVPKKEHRKKHYDRRRKR